MTRDQEGIQEHFSELVEKYPQKYVAVANEELAGIDDNAMEAQHQAEEKYPDIIPDFISST